MSSQWLFLVVQSYTYFVLHSTTYQKRQLRADGWRDPKDKVKGGGVIFCFSPSPEEDVGKSRCVVWISPCKTRQAFAKGVCYVGAAWQVMLHGLKGCVYEYCLSDKVHWARKHSWAFKPDQSVGRTEIWRAEQKAALEKGATIATPLNSSLRQCL